MTQYIVDQEIADAIAALLDRPAQPVLRVVVRRLSVTAEDVAIELGSTTANVLKLLDCLAQKGLVLKNEPGPGGLPKYSPTETGVRVYRGLSQM